MWGLVVGWLCATTLPAHPDVDRQVADITSRIEQEPRNAQLYLKRGELHRIHRAFDEAERDFRRARRIEPKLAAVDYFLGRLKLDVDRPKQAKKLLDRFLAREPGSSKALVARAQCWLALEEPVKALL